MEHWKSQLHTRDSDCTLGLGDICTTCHAGHGEPCPDCKGRGYHTMDCESHWGVDANTRSFLQSSVRKGTALLNEKIPDWKTQLHTELKYRRLDMSDCDRCVGGLLLGTYDFLVEKLFGPHIPLKYRNAAEHGFSLLNEMQDRDESWDYLGILWIQAAQEES